MNTKTIMPHSNSKSIDREHKLTGKIDFYLKFLVCIDDKRWISKKQRHECNRRILSKSVASNSSNIRAKTSKGESREQIYDRKRSVESSTINSNLRSEYRKLLNKSKLEMNDNPIIYTTANSKMLSLKENPNSYILISSCKFHNG